MKKGFTYPELIVVMAILLSLFTLVSQGTLGSERKVAVVAIRSTVLSDIRQQQLKAMVGDTDSQPASSDFGVHLAGDRYVLFKGTAYNAGDPNNFSVLLDPNIVITSTFAGDNLIFSQGSGNLPAAGAITLSSTLDARTVILNFNAFGVVTSQN
jgi:prepilin-type N-terminal cleavage/methylation domain-containing protein